MCAAMVVVVIALSAAEATAEGAEVTELMDAELQKWVYVPDEATPDEKAKEASEVIQKSKKGAWLTVPAGANAKDVAEEKQLAHAKVISDATIARASARKRRATMEEIQVLKNRIDEGKKDTVMIDDEVKANELRVATAKRMKAQAKTGEQANQAASTLSEAEEALAALRVHQKGIQDDLAADLESSEKEHKSIAIQTVKDEQRKAQTRRTRLEEELDEAYKSKDHASTQRLVLKFAHEAKDNAQNLEGLKLKEGKDFSKVEQMEEEVSKQGAVLKEAKAKMDAHPWQVKIEDLRAKLARESNAHSDIMSKEIDAKDKLASTSQRADNYDVHEKRAVATLQKGFVAGDEKKADLKQDEKDLNRRAAKAKVTIDHIDSFLRKDERELRKMKKAVDRAHEAEKVVMAAKASLSAEEQTTGDLKTQIKANNKAEHLAIKEKQVAEASLNVATEAVEAAKAGHKAAPDASTAAKAMSKVVADKADFVKAKASAAGVESKVEGLKKTLKEDRAALLESEHKIRQETPTATQKVNVAGPEQAYEHMQKTVQKNKTKRERAKMELETADEQREEKKREWGSKLLEIKNNQAKLVKTAKTDEQGLKDDQSAEVAAKKAEKVINVASEKIAKKITSTNDAIMDAEEGLRKAQLPAQAVTAKREQEKFDSLQNKLLAAKVQSTSTEHRTSVTATATRVSKMALAKATNLEKDLSAELKTNELDSKGELQRNLAITAGEKSTKNTQKEQLAAKAKRSASIAAMLHKDAMAADVQQAKANALASSLEASLAAARDSTARAEEATRKYTTLAGASEDAAYDKQEALTKAETLLEDTKKSKEAAEQEKTTALKNQRIANQKAEHSMSSTSTAKSNVATAEALLKQKKGDIAQKSTAVTEASRTLSMAKQEVAGKEVEMNQATILKQKQQLITIVQDGRDRINKLTEARDTLEKRLGAMQSQKQQLELELENANAALRKAQNSAIDMRDQHLKDASNEKQAAAAADKRINDSKLIITKMDMEIAQLRKDHSEAVRRQKREQRILSEEKDKVKKHSADVTVFQKEAAEAKLMAAKLTAANKVKLESEKSNAATGEAGVEESEAAAIDDEAEGLSSSMSNIHGDEVTTTARVVALKAQLKDAEAAAQKNADAAFAAASSPPGGVSKKTVVVDQEQQKLGESKEKQQDVLKKQAKSKKKYAKYRNMYRSFVKSKEAASKKYKQSSGEAAIKINSKKRTSLKSLEQDMGFKVKRGQTKYEDAKFDYGTLNDRYNGAIEEGQKLKEQIKTGNKELERQSFAKDQENDVLNEETAGTQGHTAQKMVIVELSSKIAKTKDKLDKAESMLAVNKKNIKSMAKSMKKAKDNMTALKSQLDGFKTSMHQTAVKLEATAGFTARNDALKDQMRKQGKQMQLAKEAYEQARDDMEQLGEDVKEADREHHAQGLALRDAIDDLALTKHNDKHMAASTDEAIVNEEKVRTIKKELAMQQDKLRKLKAQSAGQQKQASYLDKLKEQKDEDAKAAEAAAAAELRKEQIVAVKAEARETTADEKEADESQNFKTEEEQVADMIKSVDIQKLVSRSKAALAKQLLQAQGKPTPAAPAVEEKTELEKKEEEEKKAIAEKVAAEQEAQAVKQMNEAKEEAAKKVLEEKKAAKLAKVEGRKTLRKAKQDKVKSIAAARAEMQHARMSLLNKRRELSATSMDWEMAVSTGVAQKVHAVQMKKNGLKKQIRVLSSALSDARRNVEDVTATANNEIAEARAQLKTDEENYYAQLEAEHQKEKLATEERTQAAESAGNAQAAVLPPKNGEWVGFYKNIVQNAKQTADSVLTGKAPPGKPRSVERAEKTQAIILKAHSAIAKMKKMDAAQVVEKPGATADEIAQQEKTRELAAVAEEHSKEAAAASKKVADLTAATAAADAAGKAGLQSQLQNAKQEEVAATTKAESSLEAAKVASATGGEDAKALETKAEAAAEQTKLKAENDAAALKLEEETRKAAADTAAAKVQAAANDAQAAADSGDAAGAEAAAQKMSEAKVAENSEAVNAQVAAASAASVDTTATAAAAAGAAAQQLEQVGVDNMPEVSALHEQSVTAIAKDHFKELIAAKASGP